MVSLLTLTIFEFLVKDYLDYIFRFIHKQINLLFKTDKFHLLSYPRAYREMSRLFQELQEKDDRIQQLESLIESHRQNEVTIMRLFYSKNKHIKMSFISSTTD